MATQVAINGFGCIGRLIVRTLAHHPELHLVHVNEHKGDVATAAHLLQFDTVHGKLEPHFTNGAKKVVIAAPVKDPRSGIVDAPSTMAIDDEMLKVLVWYDNEYGYVHRMAELAALVAQKMI